MVHPRDAALKTSAHGISLETNRSPMAGQHPFELIIEQALHRFDLFAPRIPARAAERVEMAARLAPREMVAGEEKFVLVEKDGVSLGVARRRDHEQIVVKRNRIETVRLHFDHGR